MKRKTIISLIVCFTTLVSCNHTEDVMPENNRVTIRATQEMSTRVAFDGASSTWVNGDKLNVIVENLNDVYEFIYDASSENHFVCDNLTLPATENNIYAFYGVDKSSVNITGKSTSTQLASSSQTQDIQSPTSHIASHIAEYDILYGRALNAVGDNIDIPMSHSIAVIKVNINNALTEAKSVKRVIITAPDNVALSGEYTIDAQNKSITQNTSGRSSNIVTISLGDGVSLDNGGDYTVWAATAPFALNSGDKLTIDIETDNGVYRCEKSISGSGLNFSAGHIMSTNITLGNNATIVNNINIKVDIKSMPPEFPSDSESTITSGVYILSGYKFTFNSPSSYYYYSNSSGDDHRIRFNSGITKDDYAKITLPLIDGYKLSSVTLASTSLNYTSRNYFFAITNSEGNFIDTLKKGKILSNGLYTYTITDYDPNNAPCYIQISHKSSYNGTADITYISLSYTKI